MIFLLVQTLLLLALTSAQAELPPDLWCVNHPSSFEKTQLGCLRSADQAQFVRRFFNEVNRGKRSPPELNTDGVISKTKFVDLFKRPILVFAVEEAEHGGYHVQFVFKDFPEHTFTAWVTLNNNESYNLEIVVDEGNDKEKQKIRKRLQQKEFLHYWL